MSGRKFLLYCPVKGRECLGDFWGENRLYDIAINDWAESDAIWDNVEYAFASPGHKWPCAKKNLSLIAQEYDYYAFFDNDIRISTTELNRLFLTGAALGLDLFQASLRRSNSVSHLHLKQAPKSLVRMTSFVEIMMPVFSQRALQRCLESFDQSESGYGLDYLWAKLLEGKNMAIVDAVVADHAGPCQSSQWRLANGLSPMEEMQGVLQKHHIDRSPPPISYSPP